MDNIDPQVSLQMIRLICDHFFNVKMFIALIRTSKAFKYLKSDTYWTQNLDKIPFSGKKLKALSSFISAMRKKQKEKIVYLDWGFGHARMSFQGYFPKAEYLVNDKVYKRLCYAWKFMAKKQVIDRKHKKHNQSIVDNWGNKLAARRIYCAVCGNQLNKTHGGTAAYKWLTLKDFNDQNFDFMQTSIIPKYQKRNAINYFSRLVDSPSKNIPICVQCIEKQTLAFTRVTLTKINLHRRRRDGVKRSHKDRFALNLNIQTFDFVPHVPTTFHYLYEPQTGNALMDLFISRLN